MNKFKVGDTVYILDEYQIYIETTKVEKIILSKESTQYVVEGNRSELDETEVFDEFSVETKLFDRLNKRHAGELTAARNQIKKIRNQ